MSLKPIGKVAMLQYSSSEDESMNNDQSDMDFEVMSSGRSQRSSKNEGSILPRGKNCRRSSGSRVSSKRPCLNRNALLARENRRRKKEYLEKIENKLSHFEQENQNLLNKIQRQDIELKRLKGEVSYLRNVLNNSSVIMDLLRSMNQWLSTAKTSKNGIGSTRRCGEDDDLNRQSASGWNTRREGGKRCEASACMKGERLSTEGSDHTYTTSSRDGLEENLYSIEHENHPCFGNNDSVTFKDNFDLELDRLPQFDENIFNSVGDVSENPSTDLESYNLTKLVDNLDNCGICLHINSDKISLEFCSICHLNSVNSIE